MPSIRWCARKVDYEGDQGDEFRKFIRSSSTSCFSWRKENPERPEAPGRTTPQVAAMFVIEKASGFGPPESYREPDHAKNDGH